MRPVVVETRIERAAGEVFAFLDEVENNPRWLAGMRSCTWTSPPPVRVGSTYRQVARFLGKEIRTSFEVVAHEPGRLVTIASREGSSFPITVTRRVEPAGARGCRVTEVIESDPRGFYRVWQPLLRLVVRRRVGRDYRRLKALLESPV
ncbi:MAG TPA: SRPBCC family protein [Gaiellales bacterium]|nr:SRPBCC family protein [Gaiellales bacterium]